MFINNAFHIETTKILIIIYRGFNVIVLSFTSVCQLMINNSFHTEDSKLFPIIYRYVNTYVFFLPCVWQLMINNASHTLGNILCDCDI